MNAIERPPTDPELLARRERALERFAVVQSDLGGLAYEMAIRDSYRLDVLTRKAAELQRIDAELGQLDRLIKMDESGAEGSCHACDALYGHGAAFCWRCGEPLMADAQEDAIRAAADPRSTYD